MREKEFVCGKKVEVKDQGEGFSLEYYLLKNEISPKDCSISFVSYGAEVLKTYNNGFCEIQSVPDIGLCETEIVSFIHKIANNTVTPVSLIEVIDDFLCLN